MNRHVLKQWWRFFKKEKVESLLRLLIQDFLGIEIAKFLHSSFSCMFLRG